MYSQVFKLAANLVPAMAFATVVSAQDVAAPTGDVLLTITGDISVSNVEGGLQLDRDALMALNPTSFETSTIWTDEINTFEGVSLAEIASLLSIDEGRLLATAINEYTVEIPVSDAVEGGPIIAYSMNGKEMSIRDKGPLWIVYPYDSRFEYQSEVVYSRSIWQLDRIEVTK